MWTRRITYWLNRAKRQEMLRAEMEFHLEERAADLRDRGLPEPEARAEARRRFGNLARTAETSREVWISRYAADLAQDLRHGLRGLARDPLFAAVAILSAGLGIGACAVIFSFVNFALFRPLPVADPDRLLSLSAVDPRLGVGGETLSYPELRDLGRHMRSWQGVAGFAPLLSAALRAEGGEARQYSGFLVTGGYFDVVQPAFAAGRGFTAGEDDVPGAPARIVLTHALWQSLFGGDPALIGRTIQVNRRPMTVIGVTGPGFRGTEVLLGADFFLPLSQLAELRRLGENPNRLSSYGSQWLMALGRLRPDAQGALTGELASAARDLHERVPSLARDRAFAVERAGQLLPGLRRQALPALLMLLATAVLVLLTACANVANLMLARASARSREIATRLAIGAGRGRLIRQLLTESLLLAAAGGGLGLLLAAWAGRALAAFRLPLPVPIDLRLPIDLRVALFAAALSAATGLAFGLLPALRASRPDLISALRGEGALAARLRRLGLRHVLVTAQVAVSVTLLISAGLFLRSLNAARRADTGMTVANVTLVGFDPALLRYSGAETTRLLTDVLRETAALPGVEAVSVTSLLPLRLGGNYTRVQPAGGGEPLRTAVVSVGPDYFAALGIPLASGRDFAPAPAAEPTAIVSQELARRLFPEGDALGRSVVENGVAARIIAVAANSRLQSALETEAAPILYRPILDAPAALRSTAGLTLLIRGAPGAPSSAAAVRRLLLARDPELVVSLPGTMESHLADALFAPRLAASLFGLCGGAGVLIASIGVYGVIAFSVARRTREIGIRMALGARPRQVVGMILAQGAAVAVAGIALGAAGGLALAQAARGLIYGVRPADPMTFLLAPLAVLGVVAAATALPARRAAAIDPNHTLRAD